MPILTNNSDPKKLFGETKAVKLSDLNIDFAAHMDDFIAGMAESGLSEAEIGYIVAMTTILVEGGASIDDAEPVLYLSEGAANALDVLLTELTVTDGAVPFKIAEITTTAANYVTKYTHTINLDGGGLTSNDEAVAFMALLMNMDGDGLYFRPDFAMNIYGALLDKVDNAKNVPVVLDFPSKTAAVHLVTVINSVISDIDSGGEIDVSGYFDNAVCDDVVPA